MDDDVAFLTRLLTNRILLKAIWVIWIALPYPVRKRVTTEGIRVLLVLKRAIGIFRQVELTPPGKIFTLSFWGDPHLDSEQFNLTVEDRVARSLSISFGALKTYTVVDRQITMMMRGVSLAALLEPAEPRPDADTAIFHRADGYFTTHPLADLIETDALLAYEINGQEAPVHGFPLRLVAPKKYGYKWAKWVVRIELASGSPLGYWEQRGLPNRAWVGDIR
ncbi:MAG: molybdopterin-dependent oxidoreductase [Chloroflexota bacterium]|nr:molybdopterin-dependent oxidoreductase [Chloroflexota bacterium]